MRFHVLYLRRDIRKNGWGRLALAHPHEYVDDTRANALRVLLRILTSRKTRVVAVFGYRGPVRMAALLACRLGRRQVVTRSDSNVVGLRGESRTKLCVRRLVMRMLFPRSTRVWTIGDSNEAYWRDYVGRLNTLRISYVVPRLPSSTGVAPRVRTSDPGRLRFLFVGRLAHIKSTDVLVRAFQRLDHSVSAGWHLDVVGDGPLRGDLEQAATSDPRITIHGSCDYNQLDWHYLRSDVLVLPSVREPWGLVVNEALGFGLWVITSDQVGARELVDGSEAGCVFPGGDEQSLAACMLAARSHLRRRPVGAAADPAADMAVDLARMLRGRA